MSLPDLGGFGFSEPAGYVAGPAGRLAVYERPGTGIPLVLVHGVNMRAAVWADVVELLGDRHIIAPDLRGHGQSSDVGPFRVADYAADVLAVVNSRVATPIQVAGVSIGGLVGCLIAQEHPQLIQSVTAFGSALKGVHPDLEGGMKRLREVGIDAYFRRSLKRDAAPSGGQRLERLVSFASVGRSRVDVVEAVIRTGFGDDLTGTIEPSGRPVQVITGEHDLTCTPEEGSRLASTAGGVSTMVPGAGHVLPLEDPEGSAAFITSALDLQPPAAQ